MERATEELGQLALKVAHLTVMASMIDVFTVACGCVPVVLR
jgi:hypothetical protein